MKAPEPEAPPESGKEDLVEVPRRVVVGVRVAAILPLLAGLAVYALHPGARASLNDGVWLMSRGDTAGLREWGKGLGPWAALGTTVLMIVEAFILPIPAILVTWTNSWLFGPLAGALVSITQATLAALICFLLARAFGEPLVVRLISRRTVVKTNAFMAHHGSAAILVARLVPVVPFKGVSYVAGLTRMRLWPFVWATWVGQLPAGIGYSYLGQEIDRPASFAIFGLAVFSALLVFSIAVRRTTRVREGAPPASRARSVLFLSVIFLLLLGAIVFVFQLVRSRRAPDWGQVKTMVREKFPTVRQLSTDELAAWLEDSSREPPILVDARTPAEHAISSIASASLVTEDDLDSFESRTSRRAPIVVFCSVGYRSSRLAERLSKAGFRDVQNLEGSIFQWANEGRPLFSGDRPASKVHPFDATWGKLLDPRLRAEIPP
ncbi:VTT domain-containing protein [bacterium]|nr:VTT domain-containing protein [bacterium]